MSPEHDPPFVWFDPEAVQALRQALNAASPEAWLEVHGEKHDTTLYVREPGQDLASTASGGINDAHVCPPATDCPPR